MRNKLDILLILKKLKYGLVETSVPPCPQAEKI